MLCAPLFNLFMHVPVLIDGWSMSRSLCLQMATLNQIFTAILEEGEDDDNEEQGDEVIIIIIIIYFS